MKNVLKTLALTLLVSVAFVSCEKDDDGPSTSGNIVGKWEFSQEGISLNGQENLQPYEHTAGCAKDFLEFTATTLIDTDYSGSDCFEFSSSDTYIKSGNTLTSDGEVATIIQLDNSTLKLKYSETEQGVTIDFITVFKRKN